MKADLAEKINFSKGGPVRGSTASPMIFKIFFLSSGFALTIRQARRACRISLRNRNIQSARFAPPDGAGIQRDAIDGACGRYEIVTNSCCENITKVEYLQYSEDFSPTIHGRVWTAGECENSRKKISKNTESVLHNAIHCRNTAISGSGNARVIRKLRPLKCVAGTSLSMRQFQAQPRRVSWAPPEFAAIENTETGSHSSDTTPVWPYSFLPSRAAPTRCARSCWRRPR